MPRDHAEMQAGTATIAIVVRRRRTGVKKKNGTRWLPPQYLNHCFAGIVRRKEKKGGRTPAVQLPYRTVHAGCRELRLKVVLVLLLLLLHLRLVLPPPP